MIALFEAYKSGLLHPKYWKTNFIAGTIVGIVALPLAMAFAIASGVKPEQGIYTAIVAGLIIGVFGGTRTQIAGPTGAFVVILASITAQYGVIGLQCATMLAGIILCIMGIAKLGRALAFIPYPVIVGFTSGIGAIIFVTQLNDFFGLRVSLPIDAPFHQKVVVLAQALPRFDVATTLLSLMTLLLIVGTHRLVKAVPGPLVGMLLASFIHYWFDFKSIATLGSVFGELPSTMLPLEMPNFTQVNLLKLIGPASTIALLGAIESLLSAAVADSIAGTRHNPNQELMAQGLSNMVVPIFGGFASTGAIARTATNIRHGGNSPIAAIIHSLFLLITLLFFAPYAVYVPLCTLAAILMVIAYRMSDLPEWFHILKRAPRYDVFVMLTTFLLTIFVDLVVAVAVGAILAMLLFVLRVQQVSRITSESGERGDLAIPLSLRSDGVIYTIEGPFFFGVSEKIEHVLSSTHTDPSFVVIRLLHVPFIDLTGLETLAKIVDQYHSRHVKIYLCEARPKVANKITLMGILDSVENNIIFESIEDVAQYHTHFQDQRENA